MKIGKTFKFEAAHHLPGHAKCGQVHGHTYTLTVELKGPVCPQDGMVEDFQNLKVWVESILRDFDHTDLNKFFTHPTCEVMTDYIFNRLIKTIPSLYSVQLQEGEGGYAKKEKED